MLKSLLFTAAASVLMVSCGLDYDGSTKNVLTGTVTNENGTPMANIPVTVNYYNSSIEENTGFDHTDAAGHFTVIVPKGKDAIPKVYVNMPDFNYNPIGYSWVTYHNIDTGKFTDYSYNMGTVKLCPADANKLVTLHINAPASVTKLNAIGTVMRNSIDLDFNIYSGDQVFTTLPYKYYYYDRSADFTVLKNQIITLKYLDANETPHEVQIPVENQNLTYTIQ
ncbi:Ig-like domain-containing protein [Flavobacterium sp. RNTU_13]|uniref:Ig-like domain-containing protein n=1 Tax=Flavobacterium sp. RNTU_13 TaxID=3375145 RepID=UPI003986C17E